MSEKLPIPPRSCTVEQRVAYIAHLMAEGEYNGYQTRLELGQAWGVADSTVRNYARESHRIVTADPEEREWLRASLASKCLNMVRNAETACNAATGMRDFAGFSKVMELVAKFHSIDLESKPTSIDPEPPTIEVKVLPDDEDSIA